MPNQKTIIAVLVALSVVFTFLAGVTVLGFIAGPQNELSSEIDANAEFEKLMKWGPKGKPRPKKKNTEIDANAEFEKLMKWGPKGKPKND